MPIWYSTFYYYLIFIFSEYERQREIKKLIDGNKKPEFYLRCSTLLFLPLPFLVTRRSHWGWREVVKCSTRVKIFYKRNWMSTSRIVANVNYRDGRVRAVERLFRAAGYSERGARFWGVEFNVGKACANWRRTLPATSFRRAARSATEHCRDRWRRHLALRCVATRSIRPRDKQRSGVCHGARFGGLSTCNALLSYILRGLLQKFSKVRVKSTPF